MDVGLPELVIILVIIVLIFGPQRLGSVAGELGKGIRNFRQGLAGKDEQQSIQESAPKPPENRGD